MLAIDLTGKLAVVTGATGDLGREIALALAEAGADIAVHFHRNEKFASELVQRIEGIGRRGRAFSADVGDLSSVQAMKDVVISELGVPDILVANAVAQYDWKSVLDQPIEDYESQFRSCVLQSVTLAKAFVPPLVKEIKANRRHSGRFLAISTECVIQCFENQSAYVAGKRGMDGVLRVLAREVGPLGITVNQIAPGWMISQRDRDRRSQRQPQYESRIPLRRRGTDRDIALAAAFLASDLAGYISGAFLPVCGGNVMAGI